MKIEINLDADHSELHGLIDDLKYLIDVIDYNKVNRRLWDAPLQLRYLLSQTREQIEQEALKL